jgi:CHASE3 domain sensor protein
MPNRFRADRIYQLILAILLVLTFLLASAALEFRNLRQAHADVDAYRQANEVIADLQGLFGSVLDAEGSVRGFALTGRPEFLDQINAKKVNAAVYLDQLQDLVAGTPDEAPVGALESLVRRRFDALDKLTEIRGRAGLDGARAFVAAGDGRRLMDKIRGQIEALKATRQKRSDQLEEISRRSTNREGITFWFTRGVELLLLVGICTAAITYWRAGDRRRVAERNLVAALERSIDSGNQRLQTLTREMDSIAYSLDHHLKQPARDMADAATFIAQRRSRAPAELEAMIKLEANANTVQRIADYLTTLAFVAVADPAPQEVNVSELFRQAFERGHPPEVTIRVEESIFMATDSTLLTTLVENLMICAVAAHAPGEPMHVDVRRLGPRSLGLILSGSVNHHRLLSAMEPLRASVEPEALAAAICRKVVLRYRGEFWLENTASGEIALNVSLPA